MNKSRKLLLVIPFIVLIIALVAGVTYAVIEFTKTSNENSVSTGRIRMSYTEPTNALIINDALPISDEQGKNQTDYFEFKVASFASTNANDNISIAIPYEINILSKEVEEGKTALLDSEVKIYLTKVVNDGEEELVVPTLINELSASAIRENSINVYSQTDIHKYGSEEIVTTYRLRVWIDQDAEASNIENKQYKFTVNVNANAKVTTTTEIVDKPTETVSSSWKDKTSNESKYQALLITNSKIMPATYTYNDVVYTKENEVAISESDDNNTVLGEYKDASGNLIALMGSDGGILAPADSSGLFSGMNVTTLDLTYLDTSNVTDMSGMFENCTLLESIDVSNFDTSNVTDMEAAFAKCSKLTGLDISTFDTSNVTSMYRMFAGCSNLTTIDVSNFDTSSVTTMYGMFAGCSKLTTIDLSNFVTTNLTDMTSMFFQDYKLTDVDLTSFDTSNVKNMSYMFASCYKLASVKVGCKWQLASNTTGMFGAAGISSVTKVCNE